MRATFFIILGILVFASGCGSKRSDDAESVDGVVEADTADADTASESVESLPSKDEFSKDEQKEMASQAPLPDVAQEPEPSVAEKQPVAEALASEQAPESAPPANIVHEQSAPSSRNATTGELVQYNIRRGDTLMKIAFQLYGDISRWKDLYEWNRDSLKNANQLVSGSVLKYERPTSEPSIERNGDSYLVKKGDTLGTIAQEVYADKHKWKKIYENNRGLIKNPNKIYAGFYVYYQITEEERQKAQERKQLGTVDKPNDSAALKTQKFKATEGGGVVDTGTTGVAEASKAVGQPAAGGGALDQLSGGAPSPNPGTNSARSPAGDATVKQ